MAPHSSTTHPFNLPQLHEMFRLPFTGSPSSERNIFYDVKFYPYSSSGHESPTFVVVGGRAIVFCRPSTEKDKSMAIVNVLEDGEEPGEEGTDVINSCAWNYVSQSEPLLSFAGPSGKIKVIDALTRKLTTTLIGHGAEVNDLATHPLFPWILASASGDHSIRIWDLRRRMEDGQNACLIICGHGQAHKEGILTIAWHGQGQYLISGGLDHMICVWIIPDLNPSSEIFNETTRTAEWRSIEETKVVHYPHFTTSAVHSNFVDCVSFYGDLILSKAAEEEKIVLWQITNFDSKLPPLGPERAPKSNEFKDTRNGFMTKTPAAENIMNDDSLKSSETSDQNMPPPPYERLLEFHIPDSDPFYMRFSMLIPTPSHPELHPVLAFGNTKSKVSFWDFTRLELGHSGGSSTAEVILDDNGFRRPGARAQSRKSGSKRNNSSNPSTLHSQLFGLAGGSSSSHGTGSPNPPSSPSSRRSSSIVTGVSSSIPPDGARANSTEASSTSAGPLTVTGPVADRVRYPLHTPFVPLKPHHHLWTTGWSWTARQVAWSPCGRWCVVVGECGQEAFGIVCERWTR